ncbi:uncharacterized protein FIBRA_06838 [Fibroporia radiculosa]|uniref:Major facilitator superfamily (MFS) profile domain-containing protein n=1 Tax=Fibroporia radiculosa TaxID=599839 RepID=J4H4A5_9APHY|nr:uncharacterized protein FIBRA_06838 [Fibroporia radiculosa]CCM04654.1 predicted protein [Fibroporia radiculosa]
MSQVGDAKEIRSPSADAPSLLNEPIAPVPQAITIPDGGLRAWLSVLGGFCVLVSTFGYSNSFGVFQDYYVLKGASTASNVSWIGSLQLFLMFAMGLPAGRLFDAGYFHHTSVIGSFLYVFSIFMLSLADPRRYYQLVLSQGVGMGLGSGLLLVPTMSAQAHHWRKRRSLAMGIVMTGLQAFPYSNRALESDRIIGSGVGGLIYPIMLNRLIYSKVGFAWGVRATAFLTLGLLIIANCTITTRLPSAKNRPPGPKPDIKAILSDMPYVLVLVTAFLVLWGMFYPYFYLQLWVNLHGLSNNLAFYTIAILNASSLPGRVIPNMLADRLGPFNVLIPVSLITSALVFAMFGAGNVGAVIVFSILYGFFSGAAIAVFPPTAASLSKGVHEIGLRLGLMYFVSSFALLTGTPIVGALYDAGYRWFRPIVFSGVVIIAGAFVASIGRHLTIRRKGSKLV